MKKKRRNSIPSFIPNQPGSGFMGFDQGSRDMKERQKQFENQRKLALKKR